MRRTQALLSVPELSGGSQRAPLDGVPGPLGTLPVAVPPLPFRNGDDGSGRVRLKARAARRESGAHADSANTRANPRSRDHPSLVSVDRSQTARGLATRGHVRECNQSAGANRASSIRAVKKQKRSGQDIRVASTVSYVME